MTPASSPTLLVLAAGMGSRYGGLKQIDPVGPAGETIIDYSIFDALRAGFGKLVFVIRKDIEDAFREIVGSRFEKRVAVDYVFQSLEAIPPRFTVPAGRTKPTAPRATASWRAISPPTRHTMRWSASCCATRSPTSARWPAASARFRPRAI
ncbi:MAG: hypothetical protein ABR860_05510 [Terracidiphilus sp.]